ncbi:MAG: EAL domain-containing protein [Hyphomicrobiaceae bacterium]|nr:EAL domain-containing protein [Hyphomicrobiaceae bacterium]MCC0022649.1 EAL domain-containing protein [Hyphomicrobiaceae bacterium]
MRTLISIAAILAIAGLFVLLERAGMMTSFDRALKEVRYELTSRNPSGDVVLVEIDSQSLQQLDVWPWPRRYHAQVLRNLIDLGAADVAFDIDFSSKSTAEDDQALADALDYAGGYAYLAAFDQVSGITGDILRSSPDERLVKYANPVLVNVDLDRDGMAVTFPTYSTGYHEMVESLATTLGLPQYAPPPRMLFDYRIDISKIDRISYADIYNNHVDPARIANKQVIVGASAIELRDFFETPRFDVVPGPLLQALALETVKSGHILHDYGTWPTLGFLGFLCLIGALARWRFGHKGVIVTGVTGLVVGEALAVAALQYYDIQMSTSIGLFLIPISIGIETISEGMGWFLQRQAMQKRLQYLARHDEVTGVLSYAGLIERLETEMHNGKSHTILLIAIKRMGIVRAALGQMVANETMREIARRVSTLCEKPVGMVAPNVFAVCFDSQLSAEQLEELTADALMRLREPYLVEGHTILIDTDVAVAQSQSKSEAPADVINHARIALETPDVERTEKQGFALYVPELIERISARQKMDIAMRHAIERDEFRLVFQPQIDLRTGGLVGVEALIRWHSSEMGLVSPAQFVDLAEETGFVVDLGRWVIEESCRIVSQWGWSGVLSVNVSPVQLELSDVPHIVERALSQSDYPANRLCLEITEQVLVNKSQNVIDALHQFQKMGSSIAIDDFGTGYSSLSYLSRLPFNKIKVDQSFVREMNLHPGNKHIVETIVDLSHKLGKSIIAEGIETAEQAKVLREMGCEVGQGYYFARPVDALTLTRLIEQVRNKASA